MCTDMEEAKRLIEEVKLLAGKSDKASRDRIEEIAQWFEKNQTDENMSLLNEFIEKGLNEMEAEIDDLLNGIRKMK